MTFQNPNNPERENTDPFSPAQNNPPQQYNPQQQYNPPQQFNPQQQYPQQFNPGQISVAPQGSQGLAIASMVLGIISICFICLWPLAAIIAVLAIIFGGVHLSRINNGSTRAGKGMAIAGLTCGLISAGLILLVIFGVLLA